MKITFKQYLCEGEIIRGKFEQKLRTKKGMYLNPDIEIPTGYERFEAESFPLKKGGQGGKIFGIKKDKSRHLISTTSEFKLADALTSAYNAGGYTTKDIKKIPLSDLFKK